MTQLSLWLACIACLIAGTAYYLCPKNRATQYVGATAIAIHAFSLSQLFLNRDGFDFLTIGLLIALIGNSLLWLSNHNKDLSLLLGTAFTLGAIIIALNALEPWNLTQLHSSSWGTSAHILIASVAYSLFTAACGVGILLAMQEYQLKHHKLKQLLRVPPLQVLEGLMFEFIWAAFILLTVTIATGFYFIDDMFAQHLVHKTFFTIASWFVFAGLLLGRHIVGWRGQLAVKLTLSGFFLLMLAYFGSKIALQILLP
ncbi:cytochrome c biogenesis protein CcsA [Marinomonas sp. M1K-6]|uniref:Cytochrome c biogenesis protein CcsA n=1 Tax=Marinomonas profundi TaxID=2726122 RepID=A0A847RAA0_9GAMM|nr:cytochrome c biogenesis protein CcsA [Marinomonas profundi]NLQ18107.1 cytochrome c biogenesis protein CcsA [Marinomonas profundi]UDV04109.1 cytochrome c biogenesis protein CcsA [Marinomonas profundi]